MHRNNETASMHTKAPQQVLIIGLASIWRKQLTLYVLIRRIIYSGTHAAFLLKSDTI